MALSANTVWEVRLTNGSDTNGGGWVAGSSGTDWSQQASPQYSVTDAVGNSTTTVTSATAAFGTDVVGNICYFNGARYQITSRTSATAIVLDRATGTGTGLTLKIGGALKTLATVNSSLVGSNKVYIKAESGGTLSAQVSISKGATPSNSAPWTRFIGYTTTRGDNGLATFVSSVADVAILSSVNGTSLENIHVNCNSTAVSSGITSNGNYFRVVNCKVSNFAIRGISINTGSLGAIYNCEVTGGLSGASNAVRLNSTGAIISGSWVHDNICPGVTVSVQSCVVDNCLITNNTGASSDGIINTSQGVTVTNNTVHGNGRDGYRGDTNPSSGINAYIKRNIFSGNGGYGCRIYTSAGYPAEFCWDGNAYYSNTSGNRGNMDDTSTVAINGVNAYTNALDVIVTAGTPYTNSASNDFTLNSTASQGALLRGTSGGAPYGVSQTSYLDFGVFQHQDAGGGGTSGARLVGPSALVTPGGLL